MTVGDRIRERRKELNMTMEELGERLGVRRWTVNKYEKDQIDMNVSTIKALHNILGISYLELLDDDETDDVRVIRAYNRASRDTKKAVRAVLGVEEVQKKPTASAG